MFKKLEKINIRPKPFEFYTADDLWTDEHTSEQMLKYHLMEDVDISSRKTEFIEQSVDWLAEHFKINENTNIADFGCGPGLYATRLAKKGAHVTGIDFSKRSIQHARETAAKENLNISYVNQNYLEFKTEDRFDLIIMIMCDFCALSPAQRKQMLTKLHKLLTAKGSVVLDVYSLNAFAQREEAANYEADQLNGFWSPNKYYGFLNTFKYEDEKVVLDKYTIVEEGRTRTVYNWLQHFSSETLTAEFEVSGFRIDRIYSNVAGKPFDPQSNEFAVVAIK